MLNKEEQFKHIVGECGELIMRICKYYHQNAEDRKDMYQEVLINIWNSMEKFRGDSALSTWVYRVAVNTSLNYVRKDFKHIKLMVDAGHPGLNNIVDEDSLQQKLTREESFRHLKKELDLLPVIDKILISLVLEGISVKEMANIIGITEPNVKVKVHRIKTKLRKKLKNLSP